VGEGFFAQNRFLIHAKSLGYGASIQNIPGQLHCTMLIIINTEKERNLLSMDAAMGCTSRGIPAVRPRY